MEIHELEKQNDLSEILLKILNDYSKYRLTKEDLKIIKDYIEVLLSDEIYQEKEIHGIGKRFRRSPLNEIKVGQALRMIIEYQVAFKSKKGFDKIFEIEYALLKVIINANKKFLKMTFVQVDGELNVVFYDEDDKIYYLYGGTNSLIKIDEIFFTELKNNFESTVDGLKPIFNEYLDRKLGTFSNNNTQTITISYKGNFDQIQGVDPKYIVFYPAIDSTSVIYPHLLTSVMYFDYDQSLGKQTTFYDTFQICPPDGC